MTIIYKDIGQNFIKNKKIIKKIIKYIKPSKKEHFLEIGCGNGELTKEIIKYTKNFIGTEIDEILIKKIKKKIKNINILNINILNFNFSIYKKKKINIIGNIPYYISHKILFKLIKNQSRIKNIYIMIQKELYENIKINKKNIKYSKTNILINTFFNIIFFKTIKKKNFNPIPKVNSVFLKLKSNNNKYKIKNIKLFIHILNNILFKKNKKIINNIKKFIKKKNKYKKILNKRINDISIKNICKIIKYIIKINQYY